MGFLLTFIALLSLFIILVPGMVIGTVISIIKHEGNAFYKQIAIGLDHLYNVMFQHLLNATLLTKNSTHKFGNIKESISYVIGKNYESGTLTKFGYWWAVKFLNKIDKNHIQNAVENSE